MNVLILGSGGREHALAWAFDQNPRCDQIFVAPGNAGTRGVARNVALDPCAAEAVIAFAQEENVALIVIGPEAPLAAGVGDACRAAGFLVFGPNAAPAQLESSKAFTKALCAAHQIPTAAYREIHSLAEAEGALAAIGLPVVIKADGLAAGKGVVIAEEREAALAEIAAMLGGRFGAASRAVILEEFMQGAEASLFVLCHGRSAKIIGTAQDHKRAYDGDLGPNTGGMGAYSPAPLLTDAITQQVMEEIIAPTLAALDAAGTPYEGVLYAGLMIHEGRARLVEFNARFGDPEAQVLALRLGAQLFDACLDCAQGRLEETQIHFADDHALTVVLAAKGYPEAYETGTPIRGLEALPQSRNQMCFHAGTALQGAELLAAGGRVLNVTARGESLRDAQERAYRMVDAIDWPAGFCRRDIGWQAL